MYGRDGGANIILATSNDQLHPPENMLDGSDATFWSSTGLFPQEFIISFGNTMDVQRVSLSGYNNLPQTDGQLQNEDIDVRAKATHLRFVIDSGYDHFIAIHQLNVNGNTVHG
ncbi:IFT25-like protein [Mya arenaria]|uniref:IFT25-like protein n=1 Tax=Mya arenaria TaxID=6604 RepID=A0ABY7FPQ6_MYAAR|nr:IFT25-like protein [Mya arenaria]